MKITNKKGIGLIELIIYMAIMGILMAAITSFIVSNKKIGDRNEAINEVEFQGSEIVEIISRTIINSISINNIYLGESSSQLSLETDNDSPIIFDLSSDSLTIKRGSNSVANLNSNRVIVSNLSFNNFGNSSTKGSISFQFDVEYSNPGNRDEINYFKTFFGAGSLR